MHATLLPSTNQPASALVEIGSCLYEVAVLWYDHELDLEPVTEGLPSAPYACGQIRLADGHTVQVHDLRTPAGKTGGYRFMIAVRADARTRPVAFAVMLDGESQPLAGGSRDHSSRSLLGLTPGRN